MPVELARIQQLCAALKVARTADFAAAGVSRHQLAVAVRDGGVLRVRKGVFVPTGALPEVRTAAAHGGVVGCISRLRLAGVWLLDAECQVEIPGVGRVDFMLGDRLILEVDGRLNHDGVSMRHKDLVRDAVAAALGLDTLRFDYAMVVHEWPLVEAAILARIDRGLHLERRVGGRSR